MQHAWVRWEMCTVSPEKPQRKRLHGRPRSKWKHNIKKDLNETGQDCRQGISQIAEWLLAFQGLCPMELVNLFNSAFTGVGECFWTMN